NIISGNDFDGVMIIDAGSNGNVVAGNYIGTDASGSVAVANRFSGVAIQFGPQGNRVGTDGSNDAFNANERNVISGNGDVGVWMGGTNNNIVAGNYIGTNAAGSAALGNASNGILVHS